MTAEFLTEFLTETHEQNGHSKAEHHAVAQLSRNVSQRGIQELFAGMTHRSVIFNKLVSGGKNKSFSLTADEMNVLVGSWMLFQSNIELWERAEQERKEQEALIEQQRQLGVWKKIEGLAESIPGLEIIVRAEELYNNSTDNYEMEPVWDVKLPALATQRTHLYTAAKVLEAVTEIVQTYDDHLEMCEKGGTKNWYGWNERAIQIAQDFLDTHHAFMAGKEEQSSPEAVALAAYHDGDC